MDTEVTCERCGAVAVVDWVDVRTWGDPGPVYVMGESKCTTPGCVDENGCAAVMPPDRPGQLTRADRMWLRFYERRADEARRVDAAFVAAVNQEGLT